LFLFPASGGLIKHLTSYDKAGDTLLEETCFIAKLWSSGIRKHEHENSLPIVDFHDDCLEVSWFTCGGVLFGIVGTTGEFTEGLLFENPVLTVSGGTLFFKLLDDFEIWVMRL
jgi:hypothetical protein